MNAKYFYETCLNDLCLDMLENESLKKQDVKHWKHLLTNVENIIFIFNGDLKQDVVCHLWFSCSVLVCFSDFVLAKKCSSRNTVFVECSSPCCRACQNPSSTITQCHTQNAECISGCVCTNDTVYNSFENECVHLEQCPCQYNNLQYQPGDHASMDCNDW